MSEEHVRLDQQIAIKVMKWKPHYDDGDLISFMTSNDKLLFFCDDPDERDWKPSLDLVQAYQVLETLREDDVFLDIKCDCDGYWLGFYKDGTHYEFKNRVSLVELPKEICKITLKTLEQDKNTHEIVVASIIRKK